MANTAMRWAWIWGTETEAVLAVNWTFTASQVTAPYNTAPYVRTYDSAAGTRRSLSITADSSILDFPAEAMIGANDGGTAGTCILGIAAFIDPTAAPVATRYFLAIEGTGGNSNDVNTIDYNGNYTTVRLRVNNLFKAVSSAFDMRTWNWYAFFSDQSTGTHKAKLHVNGVEVVAEQTQAGDAETVISRIYVQCGRTSANATVIADIVILNDYTATVPASPYVDRYEPTADGTDSGVWTPSAGTVNYAVVDSPFDDGTTFTENTSPTAGHYLEVESANDIATQLGVTPTEIYSVIGYCAVTGSDATVDIRVSDDGITFDNGPDVVCDSSPKFGRVVVPDTPSGAVDWAGTDTIWFRLQVQ